MGHLVLRAVTAGMLVLATVACAGITGLGDYEIAGELDGAAPEAGRLEAGAGSGDSGPPSPPPAPYERYATARCAWRLRCTPLQYSARWANADACQEELRIEARKNDISRADYDACASKIEGSTCSQRESDFAECDMHGTRPNGAACNSSLLCAKGRCLREPPATAVCGTCQDDVLESAACNYTSDCAHDFYCHSGKCEKRLPLESACAAGDACVFGLLCVNSRCAPGKTAGEPCKNDCRALLTCNAGKCEEQGSAKLGEKCRSTEPLIVCVEGGCVSETCVADAKLGEECASTGTSKPFCGAGLVCTNAKCEAVPCQ